MVRVTPSPNHFVAQKLTRAQGSLHLVEGVMVGGSLEIAEPEHFEILDLSMSGF